MKGFSTTKLRRRIAALALAAALLAVPVGAASEESVQPAGASSLSAVQGEVPLDASIFPDPAFLKYVSSLDTDSSGGLSAAEREQVVRMDIRNRGITSLQGLEQFPNLEYLNCNNNALTSLELSLAPKLQTLFCNDNSLSELDPSGAPELRILHCHANQLTSLDVSANPALSDLACGDNPIQELDLSTNQNLEYFT